MTASSPKTRTITNSNMSMNHDELENDLPNNSLLVDWDGKGSDDEELEYPMSTNDARGEAKDTSGTNTTSTKSKVENQKPKRIRRWGLRRIEREYSSDESDSETKSSCKQSTGSRDGNGEEEDQSILFRRNIDDHDYKLDGKYMRKMKMAGDAPGFSDIAQALIDDAAAMDDGYPYYSDDESGGRYKRILVGRNDDHDRNANFEEGGEEKKNTEKEDMDDIEMEVHKLDESHSPTSPTSSRSTDEVSHVKNQPSSPRNNTGSKFLAKFKRREEDDTNTKDMRKMKMAGDAPDLSDIAQELIDDAAEMDNKYPYYSDEEPGGKYRRILIGRNDGDASFEKEVEEKLAPSTSAQSRSSSKDEVSHMNTQSSPPRNSAGSNFLAKFRRREEDDTTTRTKNMRKMKMAGDAPDLSDMAQELIGDAAEMDNKYPYYSDEEPGGKYRRILIGRNDGDVSFEKECKDKLSKNNVNPSPARKNSGVNFLTKFKRREEDETIANVANILVQNNDDPLTKKRHGSISDSEGEADKSNKETLPQSTQIKVSGRSFDISPQDDIKAPPPGRKLEGFGGGGDHPPANETEGENGNGFMGVFQAFQMRRLRSRVEIDAAGLTAQEVDKLKEEVSNSVSKSTMESMTVENDPVDTAMGYRNWKNTFFQTFTKVAFAPDEYIDRAIDPEDGEGNLGFYGQLPVGDTDDFTDDYNLNEKQMRKMRMIGDEPTFEEMAEVFVNEFAVIDPNCEDDVPGGHYRRVIVAKGDRETDDEKDSNEQEVDNISRKSAMNRNSSNSQVDDADGHPKEFGIGRNKMRRMRMEGDARGFGDIAHELMDDALDDQIPYYSDEEPGGRYRTIIGNVDTSDDDNGKDDCGARGKNDDVAKLMSENKNLQGKVKSLEEDLTKSNQEKDALEKKVQELQQKLENIMNSKNLADEFSEDEGRDGIKDSRKDKIQPKHGVTNGAVKVESNVNTKSMPDGACTNDNDLLDLEADLLNLESDLLDLEHDIKKDNDFHIQIV